MVRLVLPHGSDGDWPHSRKRKKRFDWLNGVFPARPGMCTGRPTGVCWRVCHCFGLLRVCTKSLSPSIPHYAPGTEGFVESASTENFWGFCCGLIELHRLQPVGCVRQAAPRSPAGSSSAVSLPPRSLMMLSLLAEVSVHGAVTVELCADSYAGPGGYVAAIKAAQHGLRVCMILLQ